MSIVDIKKRTISAEELNANPDDYVVVKRENIESLMETVEEMGEEYMKLAMSNRMRGFMVIFLVIFILVEAFL